jgi:hypothetical protein
MFAKLPVMIKGVERRDRGRSATALSIVKTRVLGAQNCHLSYNKSCELNAFRNLDEDGN